MKITGPRRLINEEIRGEAANLHGKLEIERIMAKPASDSRTIIMLWEIGHIMRKTGSLQDQRVYGLAEASRGEAKEERWPLATV